MACKRLIGLILGISVVFTSQFKAQEQSFDTEPTTQVTPQKNFYNFSTHGILNLEHLLEDPALEAAFAELPPDEQTSLIETIDFFNEAFLLALIEALAEL